MTGLEDAAARRLLAAFAAEAQERLRALDACLDVLDGLPPDERTDSAQGAALVETAFRETHSLKGAARTVGRLQLERLCQRLESIFHDVKRGRRDLDEALLELLHEASAEIGRLLAAPTDGPEPTEGVQALAPRLTRLAQTGEEAASPAGFVFGPGPDGLPVVRFGRPAVSSDDRSASAVSSDDPAPSRAPLAGAPIGVSAADETPAAAASAGVSPPGASSNDAPSAGAPADRPPPSADPSAVSRSADSAQPGQTAPEADAARPAGRGAPPSPDGARPAPGREPEPGGLIRVEAARLEALLPLAEELLASRSGLERRSAIVGELREEARELWTIFQAAAEALPGLRRLVEEARSGGGGSAQGDEPTRLLGLLEEAAPRLDRIRSRLGQLSLEADRGRAQLSGQIESLLDGLKDILLSPVSALFETAPRMARDLARDLGKSVRLETAGGEVRLDRRILNELRDPLIHLIRNAADHGLETPQARRAAGKPERGLIVLRASRLDRNRVEIVMEDDGAGFDPARIKAAAARRGVISPAEAAAMDDEEALRLIFRSDVSTSPLVTDVSGRGLGLAIVAERVERLGGSVAALRRPGGGAAVVLSLPAAVSSLRGLLAGCAGEVFVIPKSGVERALLVEPERVFQAGGGEALLVDGQPAPLCSLAALLELPASPAPEPEAEAAPRLALLLRCGGLRAAVTVDSLLGEEELMLKGLGRQLRRVRNVAGLTVLGSGRLTPILHVPDLVKSARRLTRNGPAADRHAPPVRKTVLLAEDSITSRTLLTNILETAGYRTLTAVDGASALEMILAGPPDLLVSDVQMPGLDGFELTARLRRLPLTADLPVILVTSLASPEDQERGLEVGANAYIVKSRFEQSNLLDVIGKLI